MTFDQKVVNSNSNKDALLLYLAVSVSVAAGGEREQAAKDLLENKLRNYTMCSTIHSSPLHTT